MPDDDADDRLTPPDGTPIPRLSGTALVLLEVAGSTNQVAASIQRFARQIDEATGVRRDGLCAELGDQLAEIGGILTAASRALKIEAGVRDPVYTGRMGKMITGYALTFILAPAVAFVLNRWVDKSMVLGATIGSGIGGLGGVMLHGVLPKGALPADVAAPEQKRSAG